MINFGFNYPISGGSLNGTFFVSLIGENFLKTLRFSSINIIFQIKYYAGKARDDAIDEIDLIHNLKHPRLTPIDELRANDDGFAIFYATNAGNLHSEFCACINNRNHSSLIV